MPSEYWETHCIDGCTYKVPAGSKPIRIKYTRKPARAACLTRGKKRFITVP
jgi:hypothetical protein